MNAHQHFDATDAEFLPCFGLSLEDAGFDSDRFFHTYGDLSPAKPPFKPVTTTTSIAWTWGGDSRPTRWLRTRSATIAGSCVRGRGPVSGQAAPRRGLSMQLRRM